MALQKLIAFDKQSARTIDAQGFLHVAGCNISKGIVNPYLGAEIPGSEQLGLDPAKTYQIFRDPEELTKAAPTFNNLPLLDKHVEVGAADFEDPDIKKHIVGSTGQVAEFKAPYLVNDLVLWTAGAIAGVDSKEQHELSCAYRYQVDMTPGVYEGTRYDGRMTNIIGNHVALVEEGRAGRDVVVADSAAKDTIIEAPGHKDSEGKPAPVAIKSEKTGKTIWSGSSKEEAKIALRRMKAFSKDEHHKISVTGAAGTQAQDSKESHMAKNKQIKLTPRGCAVQGALLAHLRPRLAADAAVGPKEVAALLRNVTPERYAKQIPGILGVVKERFSTKLTKDAELDIDELKDLLESMGEELDEIDEEEMGDADMGETLDAPPELPAPPSTPSPEDPAAKLIAKLESLNLSPADMEELNGYIVAMTSEPAGDEFPPKPKEEEGKEEGNLPPKKEGEVMPAPPITKPTMDAALKLVRAETKKETIEEIGARYAACDMVKKIIGKVDPLAMDSAESIYKMALDAKKIKTEGVHPSAYKALVEMLVAKDDVLAADAQLATSVDVATSFKEVFPNAHVGKA
jgi:hypothetical protein